MTKSIRNGLSIVYFFPFEFNTHPLKKIDFYFILKLFLQVHIKYDTRIYLLKKDKLILVSTFSPHF